MQTTHIAILIVIIIVALFCANQWYRSRTNRVHIDGIVVNVLSDSQGLEEATKIAAECDTRVMKLLAYLRAKYHIGATDEECASGSSCANMTEREQNIRQHLSYLLRGFNYEEVHEHNPRNGDDVAYSLDKGSKIMLCLRDARQGRADIDALMFVILHECAHIANYDEWGHGPKFWSIFKRLLIEANECGVYTPINYANKSANYCGFIINHNPYFDENIIAL